MRSDNNNININSNSVNRSVYVKNSKNNSSDI